MKSKDFPFKIGNREFETDVAFDGTPVICKVIGVEMIGGRETLKIEFEDGAPSTLFPSSFPIGSTIIIAREKSS